jgi:hypothetical protein
MTQNNKIFISYSWSTPNHEQWVINLAEKLMSDGVNVIIDKWYLKEGNDKYSFMESMVKSEDIDKVLIILDKKYAEKANQREGGVGTETQIISPNIYKNVAQEKFIPIIAEKDEDGNAYFPIFLEGRIYIDLSFTETYEENYEILLRNIYGKPLYSKPKLGKAPSFLFEDSISHIKTNSILRNFDNQVNKYPNRINSIIKDFLDEFFNNLKDYSITFKSIDDIEIGKEIYDNLNKYKLLRDDFIAFIEKLLKSEIEFDIENIIKFIEKLPLYERPMENKSSWHDYEFDNFRFIIHELFLYMIGIGLKTEKYNFIEELLYTRYFFQDIQDIYDYYERKPKCFTSLYHYIETIDAYYKQTFSKNYYSPMAELIMTRIPEGYSRDIIVEADLLCHYIASINRQKWFPITYIYKLRGHFDIFDRLVSKRHFEKVKILFNVDTIEELQDKLKRIKEEDKNPERIRYNGSFDSVRPIYSMINIDAIGTTR